MINLYLLSLPLALCIVVGRLFSIARELEEVKPDNWQNVVHRSKINLRIMSSLIILLMATSITVAGIAWLR